MMPRTIQITDEKILRKGLGPLMKSLPVGSKILLKCRRGWTAILPDPEGVLFRIGGKWFLNGVCLKKGPEKYPDPTLPTYEVFIDTNQRLNGGPKICFHWNSFMGHPNGAIFERWGIEVVIMIASKR